MAPPFSIAHVTPYPWEAEENEVNAHVGRVSRGALARAGTACWCSRPRARRSACAPRAASCARARAAPESLLEGTDGGTPRVIAVGEVLDVARGARRRAAGAADRRRAHGRGTARRRVELDFVHVHEPFAPSTSNAALRHSRALNVGSFHSSSERLLSTLLARRFVESFFGRLDARTASAAGDGRADGAPLPGRLPPRPRRRAARPRARGDLPRRWPRAGTRRRTTRRSRARLAQRPLIDVDLHMHTDHSHDCATPVEVLLATARDAGPRSDRGHRPQRDLRRARGAARRPRRPA